MAARLASVYRQFTLRPVRLMQTSAPSRYSVQGPGFSVPLHGLPGLRVGQPGKNGYMMAPFLKVCSQHAADLPAAPGQHDAQRAQRQVEDRVHSFSVQGRSRPGRVWVAHILAPPVMAESRAPQR